MTEQHGGAGGAAGPSWSVDVLADLHAGVFDDAEAQRIWPQVLADPSAMAVIEALDSTRNDLSALRDAPAPPMPAEVAARIDAALAAQRPQRAIPPPADRERIAPVVDLGAARRKRNRLLGLGGAGLLTAAAAVAAAVMLGTGNEIGGDPYGVSPGGRPPVALHGDDVGPALGKTLNVVDYGPLKNEARLTECIRANGLDPEVRPIGVRPVTIDGKPAVLVVFTTGELAKYRMVAFPPDCGSDNKGTLVDKTVGGTTK